MGKAKTSKRPEKSLNEKTASPYEVGSFSSLSGAREAMLEAIAEDDIETFQGALLLSLMVSLPLSFKYSFLLTF